MGLVVYTPTRDCYNAVVKAMGGVGSGVAAAKTGYHDSRENNPPYNYSVVLPLDKLGPSDGAAAMDITLSTAKMIQFTKMLMAGLDAKDPRLKAIKEVIGTRDGKNVVRYTRNSPTSAPVWASSDSSHLWHIHISLFRAYINDWSVLKGIVEFLTGQATIDGGIVLPKYGDSGSTVSYWQNILNYVYAKITVDGVYGDETKAAVNGWHKAYLTRNGSSATPVSGASIPHNIALELQTEYFEKRMLSRNTFATPEEAAMASYVLPSYGDTGNLVGFYQRVLNEIGFPTPVSNRFDDAMVAALKAFWAQAEGSPYDGRSITSNVKLQLEKAAFKGEKGDPGEPGAPGKDGTMTVTGSVNVSLETGEVSG